MYENVIAKAKNLFNTVKNVLYIFGRVSENYGDSMMAHRTSGKFRVPDVSSGSTLYWRWLVSSTERDCEGYSDDEL